MFQLVNLLGNDAERITEAILVGGLLFSAPFLIIAAAVYAWILIGWTSIIGVFVFIMFIPMQV